MVGVKCNLCSSSEKIFLFATYDYNWSGDGPFNIVKCRKCGLVYLTPRPNAEELVKYYPDIYYANTKDENLSHKIKMVGRTCEPGEVLDIGCGKGYFLNQMKRSGWIVKGLELSAKEADFAKKNFGIEVHTKGLFELSLLDIKFDLVTFWHSLEHIEDPSSFLSRVHKILKPNRFLIISTPNISSLQAKLFGGKWYHIDAPRHLNFFSSRTLRLLVEKNGFSVIRVNYFNLGHNLFGWAVSMLNLLNLNQSYLIKLKKKSLGKYLVLFPSRLLKLLLFFLALPVAFIEGLFPIGGTLEVLAIKEEK